MRLNFGITFFSSVIRVGHFDLENRLALGYPDLLLRQHLLRDSRQSQLQEIRDDFEQQVDKEKAEFVPFIFPQPSKSRYPQTV